MGGLGDWRSAIIAQSVQQALAAGGYASVQQVQVTLTQSQLLNLFGSPVILLGAPPNGVMYQPLFATLEYNPVTTNYTLNTVNNFFIGPQGNPTTLNVLQPVSATLVNGTPGPGQIIGVSVPVNVVLSLKSSFNATPIVITHDGGAEMTNGDGTVTVTLYYVSTSC